MSHKSQTLSVVIVTHNHRGHLERCLDSVKWADEIIVVDQGSVDGSLDLIKRYTDKIYFHPSDNHGILQNFGFAAAKSDWILALEPTEWVEEMLRHEIDGLLLNTESGVEGYRLPRKLYFQRQWCRNGRQYPKHRLRLFKRQRGETTEDIYRREILVSGEVKNLDNPLGYEPFYTVRELFEHYTTRSSQAAYALIERGRPSGFQISILNLLTRPVFTFLKYYVLAGGFLDNVAGLTLAFAQSYAVYLKYVMLRTQFGQKLG